MRPIKLEVLHEELEDQCRAVAHFFDPLRPVPCQILGKEIGGIQSKSVFCKLLTFHEGNDQNVSDLDQNAPQTGLDQASDRDENLSKILAKAKQAPHPQQQRKQFIQQPPYSFNYDLKVCFTQTPMLKCALQTPMRVFYKNYNLEIQQLFSSNQSSQKFKEIGKKENPCLYLKKSAAFFIGLGITFQNLNKIYEPLFFYNLACYMEPFNTRVWDEIIAFAKKAGLWEKAFELCKTAFLFTLNSAYAEEYLSCGDKAKVMMHEMRGLLSSLKYPEKYDKTIIDSAKLEIKNRKMWRGMLVLNKICAMHGYKPSLSYAVILLAKCLESIGFSDLALRILQKSIQKGISKFQAYFTYIQIKLRLKNGAINDKEIAVLDGFTDNLTQETRYRLPLCLAEILIKVKNKNYGKYISKAFGLADKFCKAVGKERAFREIYFTLLTSLNLQPDNKIISIFKNDEHLIFLANRKRFIEGQKLIIYKFRNWKYYLHYALLKNFDLMMEAFQEHNQGRIIAEAIHVLRLTKAPIVVLKFWREKIQEVPKSGQLWCEGGRIYADLGQLQNSIKCFQNAIHFTPQFGDSFIELLSLHLQLSNFSELNQLRKNFEISQPYYGNVLSFLQFNHYTNSHFKLSLRQVWQLAIQEIKFVLYQGNNGPRRRLTACVSYDEALRKQGDWKVRQILFSSYEQMENKITKT